MAMVHMSKMSGNWWDRQCQLPCRKSRQSYDGLLWTRQWTFGFHETRGIS